MSHAFDVIEKSEFFTAAEFPEGALEHMDPAFPAYLVTFREQLGAPIMPSPIPAAWYRTTGGRLSRHYAVGRKSDAGDVFPLQCDIRQAVMLAVRWFGGVGFYLDTSPGPMLHLDMRPKQTLWCRVYGRYIYAHKTPNEYFKHLYEAGR